VVYDFDVIILEDGTQKVKAPDVVGQIFSYVDCKWRFDSHDFGVSLICFKKPLEVIIIYVGCVAWGLGKNSILVFPMRRALDGPEQVKSVNGKLGCGGRIKVRVFCFGLINNFESVMPTGAEDKMD